MHRQKSILSFLKKPDNNQNADVSTHSVVDEVRGTDTPPEKVPRQILSAKVGDICRGPSLFENIMHKFTKPTASTRYPFIRIAVFFKILKFLFLGF